jgi:hypothetical protein
MCNSAIFTERKTFDDDAVENTAEDWGYSDDYLGGTKR